MKNFYIYFYFVLSVILSNDILRIKFRIDNVFIFYGFK